MYAHKGTYTNAVGCLFGSFLLMIFCLAMPEPGHAEALCLELTPSGGDAVRLELHATKGPVTGVISYTPSGQKNNPPQTYKSNIIGNGSRDPSKNICSLILDSDSNDAAFYFAGDLELHYPGANPGLPDMVSYSFTISSEKIKDGDFNGQQEFVVCE